MVDPASIRNASFSLTPTGYNPEEVDRFLGDLADDLAAADPSDIRNASFSLSPTGYNPEEVDEYLSQVADAVSSGAVAAVEGPAAAEEPQPIEAPEPAAEEPVAEAVVAEEPVVEEADPVAEEVITQEPAIDEPIAPDPVAQEIDDEPAAEAVPEPIFEQAVEVADPTPVVTVPPAQVNERETADVAGLTEVVERAIAALRTFVDNELTDVRIASELEIGDIHRERQRLIDEAADAGQKHLNDVRAHAERVLAEAHRERERMRAAFELELRDERERVEREQAEQRAEAQRGAAQLIEQAEGLRREAEALKSTAAEAQAQMLASFEQARNVLIQTADGQVRAVASDEDRSNEHGSESAAA